MIIQTQVSLNQPQQVADWLRQQMPGHNVEVRNGRFVVVSKGSATQLLLKQDGPNRIKTQWATSMGVQMVLTLSMLLTGILPGLVLYGIVWLSVKGGVLQIEQQLTALLQQGGQMGAYGQMGGYGQQGGYGQPMQAMPVMPPPPKEPGAGRRTGLLIAGIVLTLGGLLGSVAFASQVDRIGRDSAEQLEKLEVVPDGTPYSEIDYRKQITEVGLRYRIESLERNASRVRSSALFGPALLGLGLALIGASRLRNKAEVEETKRLREEYVAKRPFPGPPAAPVSAGLGGGLGLGIPGALLVLVGLGTFAVHRPRIPDLDDFEVADDASATSSKKGKKSSSKKSKGDGEEASTGSKGTAPSLGGAGGPGLAGLNEINAVSRITKRGGVAKARWDDGMGGKQLVIDIEPGTAPDLGHGIATMFDTAPGAGSKAVGALGPKAIYTLDSPTKQSAIDGIAATKCLTAAACLPALTKIGMRNAKPDAPADLSGYFDHTVFGDVGDEYLVFKIHDVAKAVDGTSPDTVVKFEGRRALVMWMAGGSPNAKAAAQRAVALLTGP